MAQGKANSALSCANQKAATPARPRAEPIAISNVASFWPTPPCRGRNSPGTPLRAATTIPTRTRYSLILHPSSLGGDGGLDAAKLAQDLLLHRLADHGGLEAGIVQHERQARKEP